MLMPSIPATPYRPALKRRGCWRVGCQMLAGVMRSRAAPRLCPPSGCLDTQIATAMVPPASPKRGHPGAFPKGPVLLVLLVLLLGVAPVNAQLAFTTDSYTFAKGPPNANDDDTGNNIVIGTVSATDSGGVTASSYVLTQNPAGRFSITARGSINQAFRASYRLRVADREHHYDYVMDTSTSFLRQWGT